MRITKFGHCCMLVEESGVRILFDPGNYSDTPAAKKVDIILITHEHQDHCHVPVIKEVLRGSSSTEVITHDAVGKLLTAAGVSWTRIDDGETLERKGISIRSCGTEHAAVYKDDGPAVRVRNTGYLVARKFFFPGDSFYEPGVPVEVLALPVAGPWMKLGEAIDYAKRVGPRCAFPVHDGMFVKGREGSTRRAPKEYLAPAIEFMDVELGKEYEF